MTSSILHLLFAASTLGLALGALGYHRERFSLARGGAVFGFGLFGLLLLSLSVGYATSSGSDRYFLLFVTGSGTLLCFQALRLVSTGWERADQLTTAVAITALVVVPLELAPAIPITIQELFAAQTLFVLEWFGYRGSLGTHGGGLVQMNFDDGVAINVIRECTGVDGLALFAGLVLAARASWWRKAAGLAFVGLVIYLVNSIRLVFITAAMAGDWFGPLITSTDTLEMTYLVAEVFIGQTAVILATVGGFLLLSRLIPDLMAFVTALFRSFVPDRRFASWPRSDPR